MPFLLLALIIPMLIGCASTVRQAEPPCWRKETCLAMTYPESQWFFAFAEDTLKREQNAMESRDVLERQALGRMAERIKVDISSRSSTEMRSDSRAKDGLVSEEININFAKTTQTSSNAEFVNSFADTYHDSKAKRVYAFAATRKSDLVSYYSRKIEALLNESQSSFELAAQMSKADRKKEALEKLTNSKKHIESTGTYRNLLLVVDAKSSLGNDERANNLLKSIAALQIEIEKAASVFVSGTESIQEQATSIMMPRLQTLLSERGIAVTEKQEEASHILSIDAKVCNARHDEHFHYANACVKVVLTNVRTGKNEITITVNGRKEGGLNEYDAGERAFRSATVEVWEKIKDKILEVSL